MSHAGSFLLIFFSLVFLGCTRTVQDTVPVPVSSPPASSHPLFSPEEKGVVGLRHPPLPLDFHNQASYLIDPDAEAEYTVSHVLRPSGEMLWLERLIHRDPSGQAHFEVRAAVDLPRLDDREVIVFGMCRLDGVVDSAVIALVYYRDEEVFKDVKRAWRVNSRGERFESIPTDGVTCENEGYGA